MFSTQGGAHAYQSAARLAVKVLPSVAKTAVGVTPWGRGILTAATLANLAGVPVPWKKNPAAPAPVVGVPTTMPGAWEGGATYTASYQIGVGATNRGGEVWIAGPGVKGTTSGTFTVGWNGDYPTFSNNVYGTDISVNGCNVTARGPALFGWGNPAVTSQSITYSCTAPAPGRVDWNFGSATHKRFNSQPGPDTGGTSQAPLERLTPYRKCSNGTDTVTVYGNVTTFRATDATYPDIVPPGCPDTHPDSVEFGATSTELRPDGTVDPAKQPVPVIPPIRKPDLIPPAYSQCLTSGADCEVEARRSARPGPEVAPDGTTKPSPTPDGQGNYCTYGPYNVPAAQCNDPEVPVPGPDTPTQTPVDEDAYPRPTPTPVPADGAGCLSESVTLNPITWVFEPVKCALKWAFYLTPATQARLETTGSTISGLPPFSLLTSVPGWLTPLASPGQSCPDWRVKVGASPTYSVVCEQGYTQTMHNNRGLFGVAMTLALVGPFVWRVWHASIPVLKVNARAD